MAWAGSLNAPGPFNFRGCDLNSRIPPRHGGSPGAIPGSRTNSNRSRTSLCSRVSKTQFAWGSTRAACQFLDLSGAWQKSDAPALQAGSSRSVTGRPPPFHCGENEIQASLISSTSVGATPTPATNLLMLSQKVVLWNPSCKYADQVE